LSEDIWVNVNIKVQDEASPALQNLQGQIESINSSVTTFGKTTEQMTIPVRLAGDETKRMTRTVRTALNPLRVASRDVWTLAYAFRRLNYATGLNSEAVKGLVNVLISLGAVLRILAVIQSVTVWLEGLSVAMKATAAATWLYNKAMAVAHALSGPAGWAILGGAAVALGMWSAVQWRSMQYGGIVPETGIYLLHKGETVIPAGGPSYSWVNINMTTGPISSEVDVDNLLDAMALRMAQESRRRGL